jgi:hypothetical protein
MRHFRHPVRTAVLQSGGASISTIQRDAVQARAASARTSRTTVSGAIVGNFVLLLFGAAVVTAAPAAAIDDPSRPDARVTHGPSCRPGGLVVEVVAGTAPYAVRLATTRTPSGEDEAVLAPGETVVLRTDDVAWGETIDGRLEFTARDGSSSTYTDELEEYSFTRPTREDCEAVSAPTEPHPSPTPSDPTAPPSTPGDAGGQAPTTTPSPAPQPSPTSRPSGTAVPGPVDGAGGPGAGTRDVNAGDTVTVEMAGFRPGELVTIQLHGSDDVLGTATAGADGTVQAEVRIPARTSSGAATLDLVGNESDLVAPLQLQVAGSGTPVNGDGIGDLLPLTAAAAALVVTMAGLVSVAGSRRSADRQDRPLRQA